jgi:hypothetical protein
VRVGLSEHPDHEDLADASGKVLEALAFGGPAPAGADARRRAALDLLVNDGWLVKTADGFRLAEQAASPLGL